MLASCRSVLVFCVCALLLASPLRAESDLAEHEIGPQERLSIRVVIRTLDTYDNFDALSGDYVVSSTGEIYLPLIGAVEASGNTTTKLAEVISDRLRTYFGTEDVGASISVLEYRPIYVVGDVMNPGEYAFRPEMTVLQAISLAGGPSVLGNVSLDARAVITSEGAYQLIRLETSRVLARRARLKAELAGAKTILFPPEIANDAEGIGGRLIEEENAIMRGRREALYSQLQAFNELVELFESEIGSLSAQIELQTRRIGLTEQELASARSLVEKGLTVRTRQVALEQQIAQLSSGLLDLETAVLRAKQAQNEARRNALELRNDETTNILRELQKAQADLDNLNQQAQTQSALFADAAFTAPSVASALAEVREKPPAYTVTRTVSGNFEQVSVVENDHVSPGDVIRVELPSLDEFPTMAAGAYRAGEISAPSDVDGSSSSVIPSLEPLAAGRSGATFPRQLEAR
jgi:protein involved in polysaccharide export with SLBB domain